MKLHKYISAILALLAALSLTACKKVKNAEEIDISDETVSAVSEGTTTTTVPMTTFTQVTVTTPKIKKQDFYSLYEAEEAKLSDGLRISFDKDDYSGDGYVTGFSEGSSVVFSIKTTSDQHYDLSFSIASDTVADCHLTLDGETLTTFRTQEGGQFTYITVYGVYMKKGTDAESGATKKVATIKAVQP